ncbi:hypothetical protein [Kaistella sp.]|uniref:hypothetical protein n=1 Tax=Kaistella sp. TaxID=2782235 RepID=UPI002F92FCAA
MNNIPLNKFEALKRDRFLKKILSNAIAMKTKQIGIHKGSMKMKFFRDRINEIRHLEDIDLNIFEKYCNDFSFYPIGHERDKFNKDYLQKLDKELKNIDERYKIQILKKCDEIINQFADITKLLKN